jgi:hypothetical protein
MQFWRGMSKWDMEKVELGLCCCLEIECIVCLFICMFDLIVKLIIDYTCYMRYEWLVFHLQ